MSTSVLGSLAHALPLEAKRRILSALTEAEGNRRRAAELLEVKHRSFYRIVDRLGMWPEIDALMNAHGFVATPGPPRKVDKVRKRTRRARAA